MSLATATVAGIFIEAASTEEIVSSVLPFVVAGLIVMTRKPGSFWTVLMSAALLTSKAEARNISDDDPNADPDIDCGNGVMIPIWRASKNITLGERVGRGILYGLILMYLFVGISQVSDRFMESIELITSLEKEVIIKDKKTGMSRTIKVKVWNKTVANLSLMVLGSSAPEIMLSVIEIIGDGFEAGSLGPGTIVGSAAFNLFIIIGICIYVIPGDKKLLMRPTGSYSGLTVQVASNS